MSRSLDLAPLFLLQSSAHLAALDDFSASSSFLRLVVCDEKIKAFQTLRWLRFKDRIKLNAEPNQLRRARISNQCVFVELIAIRMKT